jgi:hypothetical protein
MSLKNIQKFEKMNITVFVLNDLIMSFKSMLLLYSKDHKRNKDGHLSSKYTKIIKINQLMLFQVISSKQTILCYFFSYYLLIEDIFK